MNIDEQQNEAIKLWQEGNLFEAYHALQAISADAWDDERSNVTQAELIKILEDQMRAKYFGTQAEDLVRQVAEATEEWNRFMRGEDMV